MNGKILLSVLLLVSMTAPAFALQCPPKSALTRFPGEHSTWVLSNAYVKVGWVEASVNHTQEYPQPKLMADLNDPRIIVTASASKKYGDYYTYHCSYEFSQRVMAPNSIPPVALVGWAAVEYNDYSNAHFDLTAHPGFSANQSGVYRCTIKQEGDCQF